MNLKEIVPHINHDNFCAAVSNQFQKKWSDRQVNAQLLKVSDLEKIPKLMEIYDSYSKWEWRFGETPNFKNSLEKKFPWALMDI